MLDLALSVLFSTLIFVLFKLFTRYKVIPFYAIIVNYGIACSAGLILYKGNVQISAIPQKPWFYGTFALGLLFIIVFNLMAATSQKLGVSVVSVAAKMSLVLPVIFGVLIYKEELGIIKILGITMALTAVYFASVKDKSTAFKNTALLLPFLVFIGSGAIDTCLAYLQKNYINPIELPIFSATVFASAAFMGIISILIKSVKTHIKIDLPTILGGFILGIINYFSIYFLLRALQHESINTASIFTINNVAIVMFSTLLGILIFKEKVSLKNWFGIALAAISIILVALF